MHVGHRRICGNKVLHKGTNNWIWQQNDTLIHTTNATECPSFAPNGFCLKYFWLPYSPNLNQSDIFVWMNFEVKAGKVLHSNEDSLIAAVTMEWTVKFEICSKWGKMSEAFKITEISEASFPNVLIFLREHFFPNEPCAKALDLCPHGYAIPALEKDVTKILEQKVSLAAYLPDNNKIIGVVLLKLQSEHEEALDLEGPEEPDDELKCLGYPDKLKKLYGLFDDLTTDYRKTNVFQALKVERIMDIFIICTTNQMQGKGVATALMIEAMKVGQKQEVSAISCMALSTFTTRICLKLDFKVLY
eukprot:maker-scaffold991_size72796-snap-gene-0.9 protein:Tk00557 transcript:maker-scaffold991_size72796-snap-gene-0.9-mRNA-1 annotation:"dopamine n-acetyltransferase-like"